MANFGKPTPLSALIRGKPGNEPVQRAAKSFGMLPSALLPCSGQVQRLAYSIDLFDGRTIEASITRPALADAVYSALNHTPMRVPVVKRRWVIDLIGTGRAADCPSLGSFDEVYRLGSAAK